jgi:hypothetical protein
VIGIVEFEKNTRTLGACSGGPVSKLMQRQTQADVMWAIIPRILSCSSVAVAL